MWVCFKTKKGRGGYQKDPIHIIDPDTANAFTYKNAKQITQLIFGGREAGLCFFNLKIAVGIFGFDHLFKKKLLLG